MSWLPSKPTIIFYTYHVDRNDADGRGFFGSIVKFGSDAIETIRDTGEDVIAGAATVAKDVGDALSKADQAVGKVIYEWERPTEDRGEVVREQQRRDNGPFNAGHGIHY